MSMYDWDEDPRGWKSRPLENFTLDFARFVNMDYDTPYDTSDYRSMQYWSNFGYIDKYAKQHMNELENAELDQWVEDYEKNTGTKVNPKYPIRSGMYRYGVSSVSATDSILNLYAGLSLLKKW